MIHVLFISVIRLDDVLSVAKYKFLVSVYICHFLIYDIRIEKSYIYITCCYEAQHTDTKLQEHV